MAPYMDDMTSSEQASRLQPAGGGDELDDLFDYDAGIEDPFRPLTPPRATEKINTKSNYADRGLGIDKEVEITRKPREPRAKLDETRLLSQAGIPKLRKRAKDLKFKGKGHEYSDAARLLSMYQLWLDDLFPKARFLDALAMVEKEGHKKRMQIQRMAWINEGRPKTSQEESLAGGQSFGENESRQVNADPQLAPIFEKPRDKHSTPTADRKVMNNATPPNPQVEQNETRVQNNSIFGPATSTHTNNELNDDLDAILAEAEMGNDNTEKIIAQSSASIARNKLDFEDEMDAMADMEHDMW